MSGKAKNTGIGPAYGYDKGAAYGPSYGYCPGPWTSVGAILVLFILLVIIAQMLFIC
ncbi:hypothetical protein D3C74_26740 [compost metagenome]